MNKQFRYRLEDRLSGRKVWNNYLFLDKSQWWTREMIEEYRVARLKELLIHCHRNVPAYRYLIDQSGMNPGMVKSIDDLKQLPEIGKQYIIDHYKDFIAVGNRSADGIKKVKTSGTTGQVLELFNSAASRSMVWGSFLRFKDWMGYDHRSRFIVFRGRNFMDDSLMARLKMKMVDLIENSTTLDSYSLGEKEIIRLTALLRRFPDAIIRGYVLNIVDIATILKRMGLSFSIRAVSTTAEPLLDFHRRAISETFNCGIFDQYGCGEVGGVAYECDRHEGLHITEEHVITEVNDKDELLLTDLDNWVFPFVRYKNGDRAIISSDKCSCGRKSGIIKEISGRTSDNITGPNGLPVHWGYFHHLLIYTGIGTKRNMIKFQVIQESTSELAINLVADSLLQTEKEQIRKIVMDKFGDIKVTVNNVSDIPNEKSGKFRAIISKVPDPS